MQCVRGLPELQIQASAKSASRTNIRSVFKNDAGLVQADVVAQDIVRAQQVHASDMLIEIERIVAVDTKIDGRVAKEIKILAII